MIRLMCSAAALSLGLVACSPNDPAPAEEAAPTETPAPAVETETESDAVPPSSGDEAPSADAAEIETIGYPEGWEMQLYWSGEYPNAFAVTEEGVTVMGHDTITFEEYPPIYCGLPHKATYSPWNIARAESDDLLFVAMTYPTTVTLKEDTVIEVFLEDGPAQLDLKTGDQLVYKSYLAEGFFIAEKDGTLYEMNESELPQSTEFEQGPEDQEWVQVTCDDAEGTRAWVLYEDALKANGVEPYEYTGFGEAADLP